LEELKNILNRLPVLSDAPNSNQEKPSESYAGYVHKTISKIECRIKVLGYPLDFIKEAYNDLVEEDQRSEADLAHILMLRGVQKNDFKS